MKPRLFYIFAIALLFYTESAFAALSAAIPSIKATPTVTNNDTAPWRREPFLNKTKAVAISRKFNLNGYKTTKIIKADSKSEEEIDLQGIIQADRASFHALINGHVVKTGNSIGSVIIKQISRYQVVVQNDKKEKIVYDIYRGRIDKDRGKK